MHAGRGYFRESGAYKTTLSVPIDQLPISYSLHEQLSRFESIYAIDTNQKTLPEGVLTASCAVHVHLNCQGGNRWKAHFTRLPAIIGIATKNNPEVVAWKRIIEAFAPRVVGMMALVVDSELGDLPLFNARTKPIYESFVIPENTQLIYASSERDVTSPLNKAMAICDKDAGTILEIISQQSDLKRIYENVLANGFLSIQPKNA